MKTRGNTSIQVFNIKSIRRAGLLLLISFGTGMPVMDIAHSDNLKTNSIMSKFIPTKDGRGFDGLSIHPNNEEWVFTECSRELNPDGECHLLKYNPNTKLLQRLVLPEGYLYAHANFSPLGNYIVLDRIPRHDGSVEKMKQSVENGQIVVLRSDGTDFQILPISKGRNLGPIMSPDETKIAFWHRKSLKTERYAGDWSDGEIFEYDLKSKQNILFAGPFHFASGVMSRYTSSDNILLQTYATIDTLSIHGYKKKFHNSEVYMLKRGSTVLPDPLFSDLNDATNPSADTVGNIYSVAWWESNKVGMSFFKKSSSGKIVYWPIPKAVGISGLRQLVAAPNGKYIAFIYVVQGARYSDQKNAIGILDTDCSAWFSVEFPHLRMSIPIAVKTTAK